MDFFKSLVLDYPDPSQTENPDESAHDSGSDDEENVDDDNEVEDDDQVAEDGGLWSFGGLIQTITTRSESVLETYRRDLQEFGTGLRKETEIFREAASKAVKDLPASIDVAHGAIDGVIKSTAEIISQGKESLLAASDDVGSESKTPDMNPSRDSVRYSRFEAQLNAIQNDVKTYREEPEDLEDYGKWKSGFALIDRGEEIANLIGENGILEGMHKGIVPNEVDNETFWFRYFYRVHKLQQQESVRANLVKRAISIDDEEELSWDVDDEDSDDDNVRENSVVKEKGNASDKKDKGDELVNKKDSSDQDSNEIEKEGDRKAKSPIVSTENVGENKSNVESTDKKNAVELKPRVEREVKNEEKLVKLEENSVEKKVDKSEEKESLKGKGDEGGLRRKDGVSAEPSQQSRVEEEDLEWDEIEDTDSNDEKKTASSVEISNQADLRKRLSTAAEDEDLSWDIEDDDDYEPVKS